ncbi:MAG: alkaline phosphatase [Bryobacteraceae bacterium]
MRITIWIALLLSVSPAFPTPKTKQCAKNVIVLLQDAGGIATLNGASIYGYNAPLKLFVQSWPQIGLSNTSPASEWVTDSAAGMTAIVTGQKTNNGVLSESADAVRGEKDGKPLKTILEYAEERGLSTGVVTNVEVADATPAACYAHVNDRKKWGDIFLQIFSPLYGDGVDIAFGAGRQAIYDAVRKSGKDLDAIAQQHRRRVYASLNDVPADATRALAAVDGEMNVPAAARRAIQALSRNKKGYFLMIEWDAHTDQPEKGLSHVVAFDKLIRELSGTVNPDDTLLLYTADHSFDFRIHGGGPDHPLLTGLEDWQKQHTGHSKETIRLPYVRVDGTHTGEEVLATGKGPGAELIHGYFPNTYLFQVMLDAYGWKEDGQAH